MSLKGKTLFITGGSRGIGLAIAVRAARDGAKAGVDELVRCAHCGVHVPRVEAQALDGRHFCSSEHARLGARGDKT